MAAACGCEVIPGRPISAEWLRNHYEHTLQAMFVWDLIQGDGNEDARVKVMDLRCQYQEALEARFPQLKERE